MRYDIHYTARLAWCRLRASLTHYGLLKIIGFSVNEVVLAMRIRAAGVVALDFYDGRRLEIRLVCYQANQ